MLLPATASAAFPGRNGDLAWATSDFGAGDKVDFSYSFHRFPGGHGPARVSGCTVSHGQGSCTPIVRPAYSPDGRHLAWETMDVRALANDEPAPSRLVLGGPDGSGGKAIGTPYPAVEPSFSPDGRRLVFVEQTSTDMFCTNCEAVLISDSSANSPRTILNGPPVNEVAFAPSGRRILFLRTDHAGVPDLWWVGADGTGAKRLLTDVNWFDFSPDGRRILLIRAGNTIFTAWTNASHLRRLPLRISHPGFDQAVFSPDGKRIAFATDPVLTGTGKTSLYTVSSSGGRPKLLASVVGAAVGSEGLSWRPLPHR